MHSIEESSYFVMFIDDHTGKVCVYFLKWISDVFDARSEKL